MKPPPYALHLASRGIPVFPCRSNKKPTTDHGFKDATADIAQIRALWKSKPGPLIGFPTGPKSNVDILDIDPKHDGLAWLDVHAASLPPTFTVQSRSGGFHFYFSHWPGMRNSESKIAPGVDVRGEGGYVIAWAGCGGSVANKTRIHAWPSWLARAALPAEKQPSGATYDPPVIEGGTHARRKMQDWLNRVSSAGAGERHKTLRGASCVIGGLLNHGIALGEAEQALLNAVLAAGGDAVDQQNAAATIASGLARGQANPFRKAA